MTAPIRRNAEGKLVLKNYKLGTSPECCTTCKCFEGVDVSSLDLTVTINGVSFPNVQERFNAAYYDGSFYRHCDFSTARIIHVGDPGDLLFQPDVFPAVFPPWGLGDANALGRGYILANAHFGCTDCGPYVMVCLWYVQPGAYVTNAAPFPDEPYFRTSWWPADPVGAVGDVYLDAEYDSWCAFLPTAHPPGLGPDCSNPMVQPPFRVTMSEWFQIYRWNSCDACGCPSGGVYNSTLQESITTLAGGGGETMRRFYQPLAGPFPFSTLFPFNAEWPVLQFDHPYLGNPATVEIAGQLGPDAQPVTVSLSGCNPLP